MDALSRYTRILLVCMGLLLMAPLACDQPLPGKEPTPEARVETLADADAALPPERLPDATADTKESLTQEQSPERSQEMNHTQDTTAEPSSKADDHSSAEGKPEQADASARWRIHTMSFNIRYGTANDGDNHWDKRKSLVYAVIKQQAPDLLGLQEAMKFQIDAITDALPQYACFGRTRDANPHTGEWAPICYLTSRWHLDPQEQGTFWLSETPEVPGSQSWGSSLPRIATWARLMDKQTQQGIYVFNTHFDHRSAQARLESAKVLIRRMAGRLLRQDPVILMGDFNASENSDPIRYLRGDAIQGQTSFLPLDDSFRRVAPKATNAGTFHGFKGSTSGDKIDYIFVPKSWPDQRVEAATILHDNTAGRYPSDHFPITATLSFSSP